jgi:membrane protease YdiL (CAAX protease family)
MIGKITAKLGSADTGADRELIAFFALAFAITFGLGIAVIFFRPQSEGIFGPLGPLMTSWPYYIGVAAPTISAIALSAAFGGIGGIKDLFRRLTRPFQLRWVFIALFTFPVGLLILGLAERIFGAGATPFINIHATLISAPLTLITTANIVIDPRPWGEETGWRGLALPRLPTRVPPLTAAIVLGVIWAIGHAPAFLVSGLTQSNYNFGWFLFSTTDISVLMTWIYVNANGNFFVAGLIPHATNNLVGVTGAFVDVKIQAFVMTTIAVLIVSIAGPGLKGWRFSKGSGANL